MIHVKRYSFQIKTKERDTYTFRFRKSYVHKEHAFCGCGLSDLMFVDEKTVVGVTYNRLVSMTMDEFLQMHTSSDALADLFHDNPVNP